MNIKEIKTVKKLITKAFLICIGCSISLIGLLADELTPIQQKQIQTRKFSKDPQSILDAVYELQRIEQSKSEESWGYECNGVKKITGMRAIKLPEIADYVCSGTIEKKKVNNVEVSSCMSEKGGASADSEILFQRNLRKNDGSIFKSAAVNFLDINLEYYDAFCGGKIVPNRKDEDGDVIVQFSRMAKLEMETNFPQKTETVLKVKLLRSYDIRSNGVMSLIGLRSIKKAVYFEPITDPKEYDDFFKKIADLVYANGIKLEPIELK
jgi:hypothetical protein